MKRKIKVSIIGAGGSFVVGLIHDFCVKQTLWGSKISLMDTDEERLQSAYEVCARHIQEMKADLELEKTTDRRESMENADFVVTIALVDGVRRLSQGWEIAEKNGAKWGGSHHILYDEPFWLNFYQIRLFEDITKDIMELCPNAYHLLVSNPVITATTYLARKYPQVKIAGMCHGFVEVYKLAEIMGLDPEKLTFEIPGVNHFVFLNHAYYDGEDFFPKIVQWLGSEKAEQWWKENPEGIMGIKKMDLFKRFGVIPVGDTASITGASWPWYYHDSEETEKRWRVNSRNWWWDYIKTLGENKDKLREYASDTTKTIAQHYKLDVHKATTEPMAPLIEAIAADVGQIVIVNVLNTHSYVEGVPQNFEVEVPAYCSSAGIQPLVTKPLPPAIRSLILRDRVAPVEMELAAYESGSKELLKQLVMMDKWILSEKQAEKLIDDIFALPYHEELREHYK